MNEIAIAVNYENDKPAVSGRELHSALEIKTAYKDWFPRMCEYGFSEGTDFRSFLSESTGGRPAVEHMITIDMAKEICMIQRSEIGKRCREYFLNIEKQWNSPDAVMARALQLANKKLDFITQQLNEIQPKAEYYDLVLNSKGLMSITAIAKDYGKSGRWLNSWLHEKGVQYKQGEVWLLYQKYADKGYAKLKTYTISDGNGEQTIKSHTCRTAKGRLFIYELLKENGILPLIEHENK